MSNKLPSVSGKDVVRVLEGLGYVVARVRGSHHFMTIDGRPSVAVPVHGNRDIAKGTLKSILSDVDLSNDEFAARL